MTTTDTIEQQVIAAKKQLREMLPANAFAALDASIRDEIDEIKTISAAGDSPIPQINYADVVAGHVAEGQRALIKKRGCVIVRGVFAEEQATEWNNALGEYVEKNGYYEEELKKRGMDKYFSSLAEGKPQIFGVYWSPPQVEARQSVELSQTRAWLNGLWEVDAERTDIHPDRECAYADRIRRRAPGDATLGLSPHVDGGSVERWLDPGYRQVYRQVFSGNWQNYNPFEMTYRVEAREIPSPAVCRMFRTYQGWTALTPQGAGDGTLQMIPVARAMAWMLLRALQDDISANALCGATAGRALPVSADYHQKLLEGLVSIPCMNPGDTVWWHPDVVHAVENENKGGGYSNVMYIGAAPDCEKNRQFLKEQLPCFLAGRSSPDFAPENYEMNYPDRADEAILTPLGRRQMGLNAWD